MRARVNLGQRRRDLWRVAAPPDAVAAWCVAPDVPTAARPPVPIELNCPYWTATRSGFVAPTSAWNRSPDVARPW